jgi:hypothetical protein
MRSFGRIAPEQIRELRLTLPCDYNLSADVIVVLGPAARRWLERKASNAIGMEVLAATAHCEAGNLRLAPKRLANQNLAEDAIAILPQSRDGRHQLPRAALA